MYIICAYYVQIDSLQLDAGVRFCTVPAFLYCLSGRVQATNTICADPRWDCATNMGRIGLGLDLTLENSSTISGAVALAAVRTRCALGLRHFGA